MPHSWQIIIMLDARYFSILHGSRLKHHLIIISKVNKPNSIAQSDMHPEEPNCRSILIEMALKIKIITTRIHPRSCRQTVLKRIDDGWDVWVIPSAVAQWLSGSVARWLGGSVAQWLGGGGYIRNLFIQFPP